MLELLKKIWDRMMENPLLTLIIWAAAIGGFSIILAMNEVSIGFWSFFLILISPIVIYGLIYLAILIQIYIKTQHFKEKLYPKLKFFAKLGMNSVIRNAVWLILGYWSLSKLAEYAKEVSGTLFLVLNAETEALGLSCLALFALTRIKFTKAIMEGEDGKFELAERVAVVKLMGTIIMAVHVLVAIVHLSSFNTLFK